MPSQDLARNGARAILASGITAAATSVTLTAGHGARMPGVPFNAWIYNATDFSDDPFDDPNYEIVRVTARATDTLTITRGQESTVAADHNTSGKSYRLAAGLTARTINYELSTGRYNAKAYGCMGDGVTDDTAAIQALINRVVTDGGGHIFFPKGTYIIGGALQDTSGGNAQILIPQVLIEQNPITITFMGETTPPSQCYVIVGEKLTGASYSILKSTYTGGTGTACMIGGVTPPTNSPWWNNVMVNFQDLVIELPSNPSITGIDLTDQQGSRIERMVFYDGYFAEWHTVEPTHSNSYGLKVAKVGHSAYIKCEALLFVGLYMGIRIGELTMGNLIFQGCRGCIEVPFSYHASHFDYVGMYGCPYGIVATGDHYLSINFMGLQHDSHGWQGAVADIYDPTNLIHGNYEYLQRAESTGEITDPIVVGAANFSGRMLGAVPPMAPVSLTDLISSWSLDEVSGTRNDSHGTNHLTDVNTVTQTTGRVGTAAQFTAANSESLTHASSAAFQTGDISFTITAWVWLDTLPPVAESFNIVAKDNASSREYILDVIRSGVPSATVRFFINGGVTPPAAQHGSPIAAGQWRFLVGWHDAAADTVNIQVDNGTIVSQPTGGVIPLAGTAPFRIGAGDYTGYLYHMNGRIDEVTLWKRVLTAPEKTALFNNGNGHAYPFD